MNIKIAHSQVIKVSIPVNQPVLSQASTLSAQALISTDKDNTLTLGSDGKLYSSPVATNPINPLTKQEW